jgi:hypothetical protein
LPILVAMRIKAAEAWLPAALALPPALGVQVRQYGDFPIRWRIDGGPRDDFEREALRRLRESEGQETVHEFTEISGQRVVRYASRASRSACASSATTVAGSGFLPSIWAGARHRT